MGFHSFYAIDAVFCKRVSSISAVSLSFAYVPCAAPLYVAHRMLDWLKGYSGNFISDLRIDML